METRPTVYMLLAALAFAGMYVLAKQLTHLGGFAVTAFRGLGTFVPALAFLLYRGVSPVGHRPLLLFSRALTGAISLCLFFVAIESLPIAAAVSIRYLSPILAVAFVAWRLGEPVRLGQWFCFAIAFAGVVMIKGFDARVTTVGLLLVLASALFAGVTFAVIKKIGTTEHSMVVVAWFTGLATVFGFVGWAFTADAYPAPELADYPRLLAVGAVGLVGQYFMTTAIQTGRASTVMPLKYVEAVFLLGFGYAFLGETYSTWALVGMAVVIAANVGNLVIGRTHADPA